MAQLHIPGVSIAVIHDGVIEWAAGFGVKQLGGPPVTADTLFQAGSISKPVAAMGALRQVQEKKLALDADVNTELVSWTVTDNAAANVQVCARGDQRWSSLPRQLTRNVDYSATRGQRFQPLRWITITSGGFRCLESPSLRSLFSLFRQLFLLSNNPRSLSFPPAFPRMR